MNIFRRLFGKSPNPNEFGKAGNPIECPRCLGKGHVDKSDIIRLGQELRWGPGTCAFCNGSGEVHPDIIDKVAANEGYLTTDLSIDERSMLFKQDKKALQEMRKSNANFDAWIRQIRQLHFEQEFGAEQITEWMIANYPRVLDGKRISEAWSEILAFVKMVIHQKN